MSVFTVDTGQLEIGHADWLLPRFIFVGRLWSGVGTRACVSRTRNACVGGVFASPRFALLV